MKARPPAWIGPRGIAALAVLATLTGMSVTFLPWPLAVAVFIFVTLVALTADAALLATAPQFTRTIPAQLMLARHDAFSYVVTNRGRSTLRFAILEGPAARFAVDVAPARGIVEAGAYTQVRIGFVPRERGRSSIGVAFGWYESRFGLIRRRCRVGDVTPVRVRPDLSALRAGGDVTRRATLIDDGLRRIRRHGTGSEFESLRDYTPGDPYRAIDWNATARRGKVMVAQYDVERSQQIVIAVDAGRLMAPRLGDRRKLDYAVSAGLALAALAQRAADRVGLYAFAAETLAAIAPRSGSEQTTALVDALSDLDPRNDESDYERAALELRRRYRKRSLIVVFTDLFDPAASTAVLGSLALLAPHHLVLVVLMNDAAIIDARERIPQTATDVYAASVATLLSGERARSLALLRDRGIGVIDVPARDLTLALLDAYVDVKTRALL